MSALNSTNVPSKALSQLEAQEAERRHLARELHDEIGQVLTATKIMLQSAQQSAVITSSCSQLQESVAAIDSLLQKVRSLSLDLRPPLLDDLGVVPALRWYLDQTAKRSGLSIRFVAPEHEERFDHKIETACFRVVQEALTNIVRHAEAGHVTVEMCQNNSVNVIVRDDGAGFDVEAVQQRAREGATVGILGMMERVSLLGGSIDIQSAPGEGTEIRASFPLEEGQP